jgi:hypothetical protein
VFEEAAIDLGRALAAHAGGRNRRVGFPGHRRKGRSRDSSVCATRRTEVAVT